MEQDADDLIHCRAAIDQARKTKPPDPRLNPYVGAVVVKDSQVLGTGYRGELDEGEHAEYTLLERKLKDVPVAGATVYTTLEPCTTRGHPKRPCAERLVERKVGRVVIGMLDPNPIIRGKGQERLRHANIETDVFPPELMAEVEELNREFIRGQREKEQGEIADADFIRRTRDRPLDDWYKTINRVYWHRNFAKSPSEILAHLVEVMGGLSALASGKKKAGVDTQSYIAKVLAWWLALSGKMGVRSVEQMLWDKFPGVCPYCRRDPCLGAQCGLQKKRAAGPDWVELGKIGEAADNRPRRLAEWQDMFGRIYRPDQSGKYGAAFGRLMEEMGELGEAVRVFPAEPGYFLSEAADVFAWLMQIQNIKDAVEESEEWGRALETAMCRCYPDSCQDCRKKVCSCPPILHSTIGRITHEVPPGRGTYGDGGRFLSPDRVTERFAPDE